MQTKSVDGGRRGGLTGPVTLGLVSLGLGATAILAPGATARLLGAPRGKRTETTLRAVGAREVGVGVGLLRGGSPSRWTWLRVVGDMMDVALLARAFGLRGANARRLLGAVAFIGGVLVLDTVAASRKQR
jgi:hypothetical protein